MFQHSRIPFFSLKSVGLISLALLLLMSGLSAEARWMSKKEKEKDAAVKGVQTYQPPVANAMQVYCEPFRRDAALISRKPRLIRPLYAPRKAWLIREHEKCKANLMTQETEYLRHADIAIPPSLPKMPNMGSTSNGDVPPQAAPQKTTPETGAPNEP
jgi:hypothetical protein